MSEDERAILKNLDSEMDFLTRDKDGMLLLHACRPYKRSYGWRSDYMVDFPFMKLFESVKWEDEQPYDIGLELEK